MKKAPSATFVLSLAVAFAGLLALAAITWYTLPREGGTAAGAVGGPFALVAQDGRAVTERDLLGRPSLVFFGFTHCPDICPTKLMEITQILDRLGPDATRVNAFFITVDPARDDQRLLRDYLGSFHARITGLTGSEEAIAGVMRVYRAFARKVPLSTPGDYTMDHTVFVYLMDKHGRFVSTFDVARDPATAAADLRRHF